MKYINAKSIIYTLHVNKEHNHNRNNEYDIPTINYIVSVLVV